MSSYDLDRTLAEWFEADASVALPSDVTDHVLDGARRRKPLPAWLAAPGSHWDGHDAVSTRRTRLIPRTATGWAIVVLLLMALGMLLGGAIIVGTRLVEPAPQPATPSARLAYALDGDIFIADGDGRNPVRIADGLPGGKAGCGAAGFWAEGEMWSPDGRHLAYRSPRAQDQCDRPEADRVPTVLLSDPAGRVVAEFPGVGWRLAWSPDSTRVATWLDLYPMTTIGVYGLDGVRKAVLSMPADVELGGDFDPAWSADGGSLLVPISQDPGAAAVLELPIDGSSPRRLQADDPRSHPQGALSPDGSLIAYLTGGQTLAVAAADGSYTRDPVASEASAAFRSIAWSPGGKDIAFVAGGRLDWADDGSGVLEARIDASTIELRMVNVETGSVETLVPRGSGDGLSVLAFSSDGDQILFSRHEDGAGTPSLWSVSTDGSDVRMLVPATAWGQWQPHPDGR